MAEFRLMHKFVRYVDMHNKASAESESPGARVGRIIDPNLGLIGKHQALSEFEKFAGVSRAKTEDIFNSAKHRHFINDGHTLHGGNDRTRLSVTHPEGEDFIQMWWRFRVGMWLAITQHYSVILSVLAILISLIALIR